MLYAFCPFCGNKYTQDVWPRYCESCKKKVWRNPLPVVVIELAVDYYPANKGSELLIIKRANDPHIDEWALPGGFLEVGETWQEGASRELFEEVGIKIEPEKLILLNALSSPTNSNLLLFCRARTSKAMIPTKFTPNSEVSEIKLISEPEPLAFPLHQQMVKEFFQYNGPQTWLK